MGTLLNVWTKDLSGEEAGALEAGELETGVLPHGELDALPHEETGVLIFSLCENVSCTLIYQCTTTTSESSMME